MRLISKAALLLALAGFFGPAFANTCTIRQAGSTDQTVYVEFIDATTGVPNASRAYNDSGIDLEYVRAGAAAVDITEATQTAAGAHSDGGFVTVGHGRYRLDLPDAAVAAGVPEVVVQGVITGYIMLPCVVALSPAVTVDEIDTGTIANGDFATAPGASGGLLISGSNSGTTTLGALTVTGTATISDGLVVARSTSNQPAATFTGNGTGNGVTITSGSGATGTGLAVVSAATNGTGATFTGVGTGNGATFTGGATGHGLSGVGGATSGDGLRAAASTSGKGINAIGVGTTQPGILATGGATTSAGISAVGGSTSGAGILATGTAGNSPALNLVGQGSAAGLLATGGATGHGGSFVGGATSGNGVNAAAATSGIGINATGVGTTQAGIAATGGSTSSAGISATGGGTGSGILATSGSGATGNGFTATAASTNGNGISSTGAGTGAGTLNTAGATGAGLSLVGGSTSGNGLGISYTACLGPINGTGIIECGTLQSATSTTAVLRSATSFADDLVIGATLAITKGTGAGQSRPITDWVSSTDTATVATWATTPDNTSVYELWGTAAQSGSGSGATAQEVWEYSTRSLTVLDEDSTTIDLNASYVGGVTVFDEDSTTIDINATTLGTVTTATTATNLTNLPTIPANWLTAAGAAADFTTEIQTGLATAAAVATIDGIVDQLLLGVDVSCVNGVDLTGDGDGTPFTVASACGF